MKSVQKSIEDKLLDTFRAMDGVGVPVVGLLEAAASGTVKEQDLTCLQVKVYGMQQPHESMPMYSVTAEIRLDVEQAESADGALFAAAHEAVAMWIQEIMVGDACTSLATDDVFVDGLQAVGGDMDFDSAGGEWYAVWNLTLTGRIK